MERNFYTDGFEQLLKEKSDEFRMYPSKRVWHSIYNNIHPGKKWPSVAACFVLLSALFLTGYWNNKINNTNQLNKTALNNNNQNTSINNTISNSNRNINNSSVNLIIAPITNKIVRVNNKIVSEKIISKVPFKNKPSVNNIVLVQTSFSKIANKNSISPSSDLFAKNINNVSSEKTPTLNFNLSPKENIEINSTINNNITKTDIISNIENTQTTELSLTKIVNQLSPQSLVSVNTINNNILSIEEKSWIEDYALHNKPLRKKWKDRTSISYYITPSIGYRRLSNNYNTTSAANTLVAIPANSQNLNDAIIQNPNIGLEIGAGINYRLAKNLQLKIGLQLNYTNYTVKGNKTNHPISTTLLLNDDYGNTYLSPQSSNFANASGLQIDLLHNKTYQLAIPIGLDVKLLSKNKFEWFAGASIQPTYVFGGKANLLSSDKRNYVSSTSMIRNWNVNSSFETYISYKLNNYSIQFGPQFRYQLNSTYSSNYTINENLFNNGLKIGIVKHF